MSAMDPASHAELREMTGAYVLGALEPAERAELLAHLATCAECAAEVRALAGVASTLPYAVPQIDPPAGLRQRTLSAVGAQAADVRAREDVDRRAADRPARRAPMLAAWLSAAALLAISITLGSYAVSLRDRLGSVEAMLQDAIARLDRTERQLAAATRDVQTAQVRLAVLTASDLMQVHLAGQSPAPAASGRAFWSRSRGLLFAASELPPLPAGRTYQLWYLEGPAAPPVSAGLVKPDEAGRVALGFDTPPNVAQPSGFALSVEPDGGVPAPTGALYLVGNSQ